MSNSLFQGQISLNEFVELKAKLNKSSQLSIILWQIQETTFYTHLDVLTLTYVSIKYENMFKNKKDVKIYVTINLLLLFY